MDEEGNGWYYYTLEITDPQIHYFNAIISKKGALRESGEANGFAVENWMRVLA